ncbi:MULTISPECIES: hypothetical protein [Lelliottia]|jgi:hypothetical protein|uniref:Uncharacterized protein n=1 Tax=Lelliottia wanjuensis TaxID=3050585 RepID=A0AAP4FW73_9ENTR|nr:MULTISPECIES: hypothetical protein [unclassified Lelliottia]MDI3360987.1 hypothetical protein [Lelliottia sp. V89_13]MDK9355455.1 hypothetical protein [Lelliottia sp. V106_16]MDK9362467.1 hypothetical protein [Lelliottia sp. V106_12]MDK9375303.1 hypothetical protein [Lelliottia sp. V106_10]MDK9549701.1 hypothetical protein [Lelliottia sp. V89_5]
MKRIYLFALAACCLTANAAENINPRDPSIWQEPNKPDENKQDPCEILQSSVCPGYQDQKTDIQKEQKRREDNRQHKSLESGKPYYPSSF